MGLEFDGTEYRNKVKSMTLEELRQREVIKIRQQFGSACGVTSGLCLCVFTGGTSLFGTALSLRRGQVAHKKLEIVQEELRRRGQNLYEIRKRDALIPCATSIVTMGIFVGATDLLLDTTSISTVGTGSSINHILNMPANDFASQATNGAEIQLAQVAHMATTAGHHAVLATDACITQAHQAGVDTSAMAMGMHATQASEIYTLQQLVNFEKGFLGVEKDRKKG